MIENTEDDDLIDLEFDEDAKLKIIDRDVKFWKNLGSAHEVTENILQNNRPLMEIELETKNAFSKNKVQFRLIPADSKNTVNIFDQCDKSNIIYKRRIDNSAQAAPSLVDNVAQTSCTYPTNRITKYDIKCDIIIEKATFNQQLQSYFSLNLDDLEEKIVYNSNINLYTNDFNALICNKKVKLLEGSKIGEIRQHDKFIHEKREKVKMVTAATCNSSGLIAVACDNIAPFYYTDVQNESDEVNNTIHEPNYILVWTFDNMITPVYNLYSPRIMTCLTFCEYSQNILLGGCINGQLVVWNILEVSISEDKSNIRQETEIKNHIYKILNWNPEILDKVIHPSVISNLEFSHKETVVGIQWLPIQLKYNDLGVLEENINLADITQNTNNADITQNTNIADITQNRNIADITQNTNIADVTQILSCSEDGSILIWSLNYGSLSEYKKSKIIWKPICQLNLPKSKFNLPCSNFKINQHNLIENLRKRNEQFEKSLEECQEDEIIDKPNIVSDAYVGSIEGEFAHITWQGQEYQEDDKLLTENVKYVNKSLYHDGPLIQNSINKLGICLTVGGTIFALWKDEYTDGPILWRKEDDLICHGMWNGESDIGFYIITKCGYLKYWTISTDSYKEKFCKQLSNIQITNADIFRVKDLSILGFGDEKSCFNIFMLPKNNYSQEEYDFFNNFINKHIKALNSFNYWQNEYNEKYSIKKIPTKTITEEKYKREKKYSPKKVRLSLRDQLKLKWKNDEKNRAIKCVNDRTRSNLKDLEEIKKPLVEIARNEEQIKNKQIHMITSAESVFDKAVSEILPSKSQPTSPKYSEETENNQKRDCYEKYEEICVYADEYLKQNPFEFEFNFLKSIVKGRQRRNIICDPYRKRQMLQRPN